MISANSKTMKHRTLGFIVLREGKPLRLHVDVRGARLAHSDNQPWATLFPSYLRAWRAVDRTLIFSRHTTEGKLSAPLVRRQFEIIRVIMDNSDLRRSN